MQTVLSVMKGHFGPCKSFDLDTMSEEEVHCNGQRSDGKNIRIICRDPGRFQYNKNTVRAEWHSHETIAYLLDGVVAIMSK